MSKLPNWTQVRPGEPIRASDLNSLAEAAAGVRSGISLGAGDARYGPFAGPEDLAGVGFMGPGGPSRVFKMVPVAIISVQNVDANGIGFANAVTYKVAYIDQASPEGGMGPFLPTYGRPVKGAEAAKVKIRACTVKAESSTTPGAWAYGWLLWVIGGDGLPVTTPQLMVPFLV